MDPIPSKKSRRITPVKTRKMRAKAAPKASRRGASSKPARQRPQQAVSKASSTRRRGPPKFLSTRVGQELTITKRVARGPLGDVFAGVHPVLARRFAIKVLRSNLTRHESTQDRLRRVMREVSTVDCPGVVPLLDFGCVESGRFYLTMNFIRGTPLARILAERGSASLQWAISMLLQLSEALEGIHRARVVHGDLKPSNVLVMEFPEEKDRIQLIDLSLVSALSPEPIAKDPLRHLRHCSSVAYLSPEQIAGTRPDPLSDVYSFGALGYHLVVGQQPFSGSAAEIIGAHELQEPEVPSRSTTGYAIPASLGQVILRCMRKRPQQRYGDMGEVRQALEDFLAGADSAAAQGPTDWPPLRASKVTTRSVRKPGTGPLPSSAKELRELLFNCIHDLSGLLLHRGLAGPELGPEYESLGRVNEEMQACDDRCEDTERRAAALRQQMRERESKLRYAIIDLNLLISGKPREDQTPEDINDVEYQIKELEVSLGRLETEFSGQFSELDAELRGHRDYRKALEQQMTLHYHRLHTILDQVRHLASGATTRKLYDTILQCRQALKEKRK